MRQYRGNLKDQWIDFKYWGLNWLCIITYVLPHPIKTIRAMFKYPWVYDLLKTNDLSKRLNVNRNGTSMLLSMMAMNYVCKNMVNSLKALFYDPSDTILNHCMVVPDLYFAMGIRPFAVELPALVLPMLDQHSPNRYMDLIESEGLPGDTCSYPRITAGVMAAGQIPKNVRAMIASNLPCEGGMKSYAAFEKSSGLPTYRLDIPYNFKSEDGLEAFGEDIKGMIAFLEKHTGHKMDWCKLKQVCEVYNEMNELELERWEFARSDIPTIANENIWLPHIWEYNLDTGNPEGLKLYKDMHEQIKKAHARQEPAVKNMRHRVVLWNPPTFGYAHFWNWMERCWGIGCLMDMESFGNFENLFIDTSSKETILRGLAKRYCNATMARHTRGAAENYLDDIWKMVEMFRADFIIVANHIGCRSSISLLGVMKEEAQKRGIQLCIFDYELMDNRVCSRQGIRDQISTFMSTVLQAEPLDESLLVIKDESDW